MRPLIDRLRQVVERGDDIGSRNLAMMQEAADELEQALTGKRSIRCDKLHDVDTAEISRLTAELERVTKERDALREALEQVVIDSDHPDILNYRDTVICMADVAREALK